jgi:hypothetical protein
VVVAPPPAVVVAPPPRRQTVVVAPPALPAAQYVWVPEWGVYVLADQDIVYYENAYYYYYGGRWYASPHHTGPWAFVSSPPVIIGKLPRGQFHRHMPPGLAKKGKIPPGHMR